jgi:hypothetical protein
LAQVSLKASDKLILTPTANLPDGTRVKPILSVEEENNNKRLMRNAVEPSATADANVSVNNNNAAN